MHQISPQIVRKQLSTQKNYVCYILKKKKIPLQEIDEPGFAPKYMHYQKHIHLRYNTSNPTQKKKEGKKNRILCLPIIKNHKRCLEKSNSSIGTDSALDGKDGPEKSFSEKIISFSNQKGPKTIPNLRAEK